MEEADAALSSSASLSIQDPYAFEPLDHTKDEIRLIQLIDAPDDEPVSCSLIKASSIGRPCICGSLVCVGSCRDPRMHHCRRQKPQQYEKLKRFPVAVEKGPRRCRSTALFRRCPEVPWADAICINQQDGEEKVHQIEIMRSIYRRAKLVVSMVGRPNEGMEMGIRMMRTIAEASSPQNLQNRIIDSGEVLWLYRNAHFFQRGPEDPPDSNAYLRGIHQFSVSEYWKRIWILQEIALPRPDRLFFLCGSESLSAKELLLFKDFARRLRRTAPPKPRSADLSIWVRLVNRQVPLFSAVDILNYTVLDLDLQCVLRFNMQCAATHPLDAVYGLLGLIETDIKVDYSKPVEKLYIEWWKKVICQKNGLGCLYYSGIGLPHHAGFDLPSWAINLHTIQRDWTLAISTDDPAFPREYSAPMVDGGVFDITPENILRVPGVQWDRISEAEMERSQLTVEERRKDMFDFCISYRSRYNRTGQP